MPEEHHQLELPLTISPDVSVMRLPGGEVRMKPKPPQVQGSVKDAARILGTSRATVRRLWGDEEIKGYRPGKSKIILDMVSVYDYKARKQKEQQDR